MSFMNKKTNFHWICNNYEWLQQQNQHWIMCKIQCFILSQMVDGGGHMTSAAIVSLSSSVYAWLESNCEWTLNSARVDRCHFSWQAIVPVPVFLVPFILALSHYLSREISWLDKWYIFSLDSSWRAHAQHRNAGKYQESGQFKRIREFRHCFH